MSRRRAAPVERFRWVLTVVLVGAVAAPTLGQEEPDLSDLTWRNIGPAVTGGRIVDFAVNEADPDTFWVATASSGIWRTDNGGDTWTPQFTDQRRVALGGIAVAPGNPHVLWAGTGEPNARNLRSSSWGDGVYVSRDGGDNWTRSGLEMSQQIGRIVIDPRDEDVVFVAALGSMWHDDPDKNAARGLWRTRDGGSTWQKVLDGGPRAGAVEVAQDLSRPDRLYAATWERERRDWSFRGRGPGSAIYRSRDGGDTWELSDKGLPAVDRGRIGLSVCRSAPDTVYAVIDAAGEAGGLYRSRDAGASWEHRSSDVGASMYYGQVRCDPTDPDRVYVLQTRMSVSSDGGSTFSTEIPDSSVHVDHHALWIDPEDPEHLLLGNDGGVYLSRDGGRAWRFAANLPITQFYTVAVDRQRPFYRVYGGTQDNNSLGGPSGTRNRSGIVNADWFVTVGGDGFFLQIDPDDPGLVYTEWQYGNLVRFDARTGERKAIKPEPPVGESYRWNWSAPLLLSEHPDRALYFGAQYLFRSLDRGDSWERLGPDLTRAIDIDEAERISDYGTLRVIAESSHDPALLAVGTDDGLVQITEDGGGTWRVAEAFPGVPATWQVVRLAFSVHDADRMYAAVSGHEWDDFRPYLLRSDDRGRSWDRIDGGLPADEPIRAFAEHPEAEDLLWVGTEFGVHASLDGGAGWRSMRANLPTVPVHDLLIHPDTHDVVLGTHGRGFWVLDGTAGLAALASRRERLSEPAILGIRSGIRLVEFDRGKRNEGASRYTAPNPPTGVSIDLWLPAGDEAELRILDADGSALRRMEISAGPRTGLRRVDWDLRTDALYESPGDEWGRTVPGARVLAGEYEVVLHHGGGSRTATARVVRDPDLMATPEERAAQLAAALEAGRALGVAQAAAGTVARMRAQLDAAVETLERAAAGAELIADAERALAAAGDLSRWLDGPGDGDSRPPLPVLRALYRQIEGSPSAPTAIETEMLREARAALDEGLRRIEALSTDWERIAAAMDAAGIEWTPGRPLVRGPGGER